MIRVSKLADYGTVVMVYMAQADSEFYNARDIAEHTHINLPTVSKILKLLARVGLLISKQGTKGGYALARKPEDISVTEIISALDGDFGMTDCSHGDGNCQLEAYCAIRPNWRLISHAIYQALECINLAEMAKPIRQKKLLINKDSLLGFKTRDERRA